MKNLQILIYNLLPLNLNLEFEGTFTGHLEKDDKIYSFKNEWLTVEIQAVDNEFKQYTLYPNVNKFDSRDYDNLYNGVSIYLVKDICKYLNEVIENFDKQVIILEKLLKEQMKLVRHYDLTDRMYLGIK